MLNARRLAIVCAAALGVSSAASAQPAQRAGCAARHQAFVEGGVAQGHMNVTNNGAPCAFTFKFGGSFEPSDGKVEAAPRHGHVDVDGGTVKYTPEPGYVGTDEFTIALFGFNPMLGHGGRSRNGQFHFDVDVHAPR